MMNTVITGPFGLVECDSTIQKADKKVKDAIQILLENYWMNGGVVEGLEWKNHILVKKEG